MLRENIFEQHADECWHDRIELDRLVHCLELKFKQQTAGPRNCIPVLVKRFVGILQFVEVVDDPLVHTHVQQLHHVRNVAVGHEEALAVLWGKADEVGFRPRIKLGQRESIHEMVETGLTRLAIIKQIDKCRLYAGSWSGSRTHGFRRRDAGLRIDLICGGILRIILFNFTYPHTPALPRWFLVVPRCNKKYTYAISISSQHNSHGSICLCMRVANVSPCE
jgi:hypothetical protein